MTRQRIVSLSIIGVLAVAALVFHARLIAWFTGGAADTGTAATVTAGPWHVAAALDPDPPRQKAQRVRATVTANGAPVDGATVEITADMPAMGSMAEMKSTAPAQPDGSGVYDGTLDLPMGGSWGIWVKITANGTCAIARFSVVIGQAGIAPEGSGGCGGTQAIEIAEHRQREVGITAEAATKGPLTLAIRAVGKLAYDESRLSDVVLKVGGYVSSLRVRAIGQPVTRGETLFMLYSPDLFAAEQDYLVAKAANTANLMKAAETRLALLGVTPAQIQQLADKGEPIEKLAFASPASGSVIEKTIVEGDAVQAGQRIFRIAALDKVWVEADLFEADLGKVKVGMPANVAIGSGPPLAGKVTFVYPYLDPQTRTGRVRIELPNKGLELKPDMFATVTFEIALADRLTVPTSAIVYTGPRRVVYVELGGGKLEPRDVELGAQSGDRTEIAKGLQQGDVIVTSGNFLVAAESRLRGVQ